MNAKDTIKAVNDCTTINDLSKYTGDPRKSVQTAIEKKRNELLAENESGGVVKGKTHSDAGEQKKIAEFRSKIPFTCRAENVIAFAKSFFADNLVSAEKVAVDHVKIILKSGTEVSCRVV